MKSPDMLPHPPGARPPVPDPSGAPPGPDSPLPLTVVSERPPLTALPADSQPPLRAFVARYETAYGITTDVLASQLHLPPTVFARYADSYHPPRWLVLAVAGVGTARGIPADELSWLLDALQE